MKDLKGLDSRQIPKIKEICANKKYHDILYSYLQEHSIWDGEKSHRRYVEKKLINFSELGRQLQMSRQTVASKFNNFIDLKLIEPSQDGQRYYLESLSAEVAGLIPEKTLSLLVNALSKYSISVYLYLLMRYVANGEQPYLFTLNQIKAHIGLTTTTRSNNNVITDILYTLQKLELIKYSLTILPADASQDVQTIYQLDFLTNYIDC